MKKYKARMLPEHLSVHLECVGVKLPLLLEHQIYTEPIGSVIILNDDYCIIESDSVNVGDKLSSGSFLMEEGKHYIREVSVVSSPKYPECEILEVVDD